MLPKPLISICLICQRCLLAALIVLPLVFNPHTTPASHAAATTLLVDTILDSNDPSLRVCSEAPNDCSLRGAISLANANRTQAYTLTLADGTYPLFLPGASEDDNATGDLDLFGQVTLSGSSAQVFINGVYIDRLLHIHPGAIVFLDNLHLTGGKSPDGADGAPGEPGGGIYNQGSLFLRQVTLADNQAGNGGLGLTGGIDGGDGGSGGGIQNEGALTIEDSRLSGNRAGSGGAGYVCDTDPYDLFCGDCSTSGNGGLGGGVNNSGTLTLRGTAIEDSAAGEAGPPGICLSWGDEWYFSGQPGTGGGVANQNALALFGSTLTANQGRQRGGGLDTTGYAKLVEAIITDNQAVYGGGISNLQTLAMEESSLDANTGDTGGGIYNEGQLHMLTTDINNNNAALGGGLYNLGQAALASGGVKDNWTRDGLDGADETPCVKDPCPPTDGGSPHGGGIFNAGDLQLDASQITRNATGDGGDGGDAFMMWSAANGGHGGFGGGVYNTGTLTINFTEVLSNTTGDGGLGGVSPNGDGVDGKGGFGGGIYNAGVMTATLSPLADNHTGSGLGGAGSGGGLANQGQATYSYGDIIHNQTSLGGDGGGIYTSGPLILTETTLTSNAAGGRGGGIFAASTSLNGANNLIAHNTTGASFIASGIYLNASSAALRHTTLSQNTGGDGSALLLADGATLALTNTIIVSHTLGISATLGTQAILEHTLWGAGVWANHTDWAGSGSILTGTNNLWLEPGFLDPAALDYHLAPDSAALDQGISAGIPADIDNQPRPNPATGVVDLGADEYWLFTPVFTLTISGPVTDTANTPLTFSVTVIPDTATPNVMLYWMPPPDSGQWTDTAVYHWGRPGIRSFTVLAIQADHLVYKRHLVEILPRYGFLPVVVR